jgi:toxin-antitoxin system PIN domain toxin
VILVDANLLVYAKFSDLPQHQTARAFLEGALNTPARVGLPWPSLLAFLRLASNPRIFAEPLSVGDAWAQVCEWLGHPRVWVPEPTTDHRDVLGRLLVEGRATGNLVPDAHLAALAICHGLTLCSTDSDFARFAGLDWRNPLSGARL